MNSYPLYLFRRLHILAACLLFIVLSGCAITPDNWAFQEVIIKTETLSQVKRIALLDVPPPKNIVLGSEISGSAGQMFGLIGLMTIEDTEGNKITSASLVSDITLRELKGWLELAGKEVVLVNAVRQNKREMLESYEQFSQVDADAILEVAPIRVGFMWETGKFEFQDSKKKVSPETYFAYRLVSAKSGEVLIQSNVYYSSFDYSASRSFAVSTIVGNKIRGPSWHIFENEDAVKNNQEEAIKRLSYAIKKATELISVMVTD